MTGVTQQLEVRNWTKHQHYSDRRPPWIKVYVALLDDLDYLALSDAAQAGLIRVWLLASRLGHPLPMNRKLICGKAVVSDAVLDELIAGQWLAVASQDDASKPASASDSEKLAPRARGRALATELEGERELELQLAAARGKLRVDIARAANDAIDAVFGTSHKRRALMPATAAAVLEVLDADAIPPDFAITAIAEAVPSLKEPPRSLAYFAPIVKERWERQQLANAPSAHRSGSPRASGKRARNLQAIERGLKLTEAGVAAHG